MCCLAFLTDTFYHCEKSYRMSSLFWHSDEYRIKPVEEVKYMKNGAEEEQKIAARNQENLGKSASSNVRL